MAKKESSPLTSALEILQARPIAVDLFSGVGGLGLGFEQAGFYVSAAIEIDERAGRYAQYNMPATVVLRGDEQGDVRRFGKKRLLDLLPHLKDEITCVVGGPPCQGFSLAGKRLVDDPLNDLVLEFARVVHELSPASFLMENVPGITYGNSKHLAEAVKKLSVRYRVSEPTKLLASDFGVPQMRARIFLLGIRKDLKIDPSLPKPTHLRCDSGSLLFNDLPRCPTAWEAVSDLPEVDDYEVLIDCDRVPYDKQPTNDYQRYMREHTQDPNDLSLPVKWDSSTCTDCRRTRHGDSLVKRLRALPVAGHDPVSKIRRIDPNDVCTTIRAGSGEDRGRWSAPRPMHPYAPRVLTTRECARIQSFPDWFFFHPAKWNGNRQVGNAVPPLLARPIAQHLLRLLGIQVSKRRLPRVARDESLVTSDIEEAAGAGLSTRPISQMVLPRNVKKAHLAL